MESGGKAYTQLVEEDKYLSPAGKEAYAKYKEEEAQKALEKAQAAIERKNKRQPVRKPLSGRLQKSLTGIVCQRIQRRESFRNMALNG